MPAGSDDERVRVCQVVTHLDIGGATQAALNSCAYLDQDRFESWLVSGPPPHDFGDAAAQAEALGVEVVTVPRLARSISPAADAAALSALQRVFRERRPHVVHTHSSKAGMLGRVAARREGVPVVVHTVHGWSFHDHMPVWQRRAYLALERLAARWTDAWVTVSESDRAKGLAAGIGSPDRYELIYEINDLAPFFAADGAKAAARSRLGLPAEAPVVGTVGRLSDQKDPLTFVRAAAAVARQVDDVRFVMLGDGPLRHATEDLVAEFELTGRFTITGYRDSVDDVLPALDVFALTSRWEGMPLVIPQAMASGVAVVATAVDGSREVVRDRENGLLTSPGEPEAVAKCIVELLSDPSLSEQLVQAGRVTAEAFRLDRTIPQLEAVYLARVAYEASVPKPDRRALIGGPAASTVRNIARNALRPGYLRVMAAKVATRFTDRPHAARAPEAIRWGAQQVRDAGTLARDLDPDLWDEATDFGGRLEARARGLLPAVPDTAQGGGHYPLLYFLVRYYRPEVAVETGVALGFSSAAILSAMDVNGGGHLYSSDFPEFRRRDPERGIGCLVDDRLRDRWSLYLRGDRKNLDEILAVVDHVDLFHYDSDKSYVGRQAAMQRIEPRLHAGSILVMDDIQDNLYFRDYVEQRGPEYEVLEFSGKYLGLARYRAAEPTSSS